MELKNRIGKKLKSTNVILAVEYKEIGCLCSAMAKKNGISYGTWKH